MSETLSYSIAESEPVTFIEMLPDPGSARESDENLPRIRHIFRNAHFYSSRRGVEPGSTLRALPGGEVDCAIDLNSVTDILSTLPSPPSLIAELLKTVSNENLSVDVLAKKIAADQAMVARLLQVANSSFYGLQGKVISVADAILVLGTGNVRNLILTVSVSNSLSSSSSPSKANFHSFWMHGIATAICAEKLAKRMGSDPESAFAAGLLHDIGQIALAVHFPLHYEKAVRYHHQVDCHLFEAEEKVLGISHSQVGEYLCKRWKFPAELCTAIAGHHDPDLMDNNPLASVVHLADAMVHALNLANNDVGMMPRIYSPCWQLAQLSWTDCQEILDQVDIGVSNFSKMLGQPSHPHAAESRSQPISVAC